MTVYLKPVYSTTIAASNGRTFAESGLFPGGVAGAHLQTEKIDHFSPMHGSINVVIYDLVRDGTLFQIFESLGSDRTCITESQVVAFYANHLCKGGYVSVFEIEPYLTACVSDNSIHRSVVVSAMSLVVAASSGNIPIEYSNVWKARWGLRFVVPVMGQ